MNVSVILPTYNERENIVDLVEHLKTVLDRGNYRYEIMVVDDHSPDGTARAVRDRFGRDDAVKLICRNGQRGLATAVRRGIEECRGDVIVLMDADFSHRPEDLPALLEATSRYDLVNGSRYLSGGGFQGTFRARCSSMLINWFLRVVLDLETSDNTSGFLAVRRTVLEQLSFDRIFHGYGDFHFRLLRDVARRSGTVLEVPVIHQLRHRGRAKTRLFRDGWGYVRSAVKIRLDREEGDHGAR
jgi:dolichol-phosphate mannosyltransferase